MQATDVAPTRLDAAKAAAIDALKELPGGGKVSVIAAGRTARVVANGTDDIGNVKAAINAIQPTSDIGDLGDALRLASALAARSGDAEILVATDAALATPPSGALEAPVRVLQVGREARNEAIVALAVRTAPSGLSHSAFVSRGEPRPDHGRAARPALRRRRAAGLAGPGPGSPAQDGHLHRRYRRPGSPGIGGRGAPSGQGRDGQRGAGRAGRRRPRRGPSSRPRAFARSCWSARATPTWRPRCPISPTRSCTAPPPRTTRGT